MITQPVGDIEAATAMCRQAIEEEFAGFGEDLPGAPDSPLGWFDLVGRFPPNGGGDFARLRAAADAIGGPRPVGGVERYALLQALQVALPRVAGQPVHERAKRMFAAACTQMAWPEKQWLAYFDHSHPAFYQLARVAALDWFPVGSLAFQFTGFPRSWLLKIHPAALPAFLRELYVDFGGGTPVLTPHLLMWRRNPFLLLQGDYLRALWQIAETLKMHPEVKGLMADSWYFSAEVGTAFPHLAWLRSFFCEHGAHLVGLERAPSDSGLMAGSSRRRELYHGRQFRPRRTLVLWHRAAMLSWAESHPELAEPSPARNWPAKAAVGNPVASRAMPTASPAAGWPSGGDAPQTIADRISVEGRRLLNERPKLYIILSILAPSCGIALSVAATKMWWAALPAFLLSMAVTWLAQYFYVQ
jgi:hypothetical protein